MVKAGDINIYYEVHGEGEPLVLIMGYGANSGQWFRQVPGLSQRYQIITFDNRGTGRSDKPDISYTMEMMAGDVAGLLDAIGIEDAHIYGISMGGMIAQHFALNYPEKVIGLILGCTMCGGEHSVTPDAEAIAVLFDMERMQRLTPEEMEKEMVPFLFSQQFVDNNADIIEQFVARSIEYVTPFHGFTRQTEAIMGHNTYEHLPDIKTPALVLSGDADRIIPVENSRLIASRIPGAELIILEGMGHGFFIEAAEEANGIIMDFLGRHPYTT
jgi:pimeloyl-ACP methyl ester carboxylesterase